MQQRFQNSTFERWQLPANQSVSEALATLQANDLVAYAEPNYIWQKHKLPNDPLLSQSWALNNIGQTVPSANEQGELVYINGTPGADLDLRQAWDITTGSRDVVIAVIDDGMDMDHPDLRANLWTNPDEIPNDGLDNDGNDYIDDIHGWDMLDQDNNPDHEPADFHGTLVAGSAGAVGNNAEGVSGSAWQVSLMPLRTGLDTASILEAFEYVIQENVPIVNASWGGKNYSQALAEGVNRLEQAGVLLIVSAGNHQINNDYIPIYPASYQNANILAVSASTATGTAATWAHHGQTSVDLAAPGAWVFLPTVPSTGEAEGIYKEGFHFYGYADGTSFSAPYAAGVAALLKTRYPNADYRELKARLITGTRPFDNNWQYLSTTNGRLSALKALQAQASPVLLVRDVMTKDEAGQRINRYDSDRQYTLSLELENIWQNASAVTATLHSPDDFITIEQAQANYTNIPAHTSKRRETFRFTLQENAQQRPLRFEVTLKADNQPAVKRRFFLENVQTMDQAMIVLDGEGEVSDVIQPEEHTYFNQANALGLKLPEGYRLLTGIDMQFKQAMTMGDNPLLGWRLSYLPQSSELFSCKNQVCDQQVNIDPNANNEFIYPVVDGGALDADKSANGQITSTLVLLQRCEPNVSCKQASSDGGGGGRTDYYLLGLLLLLAAYKPISNKYKQASQTLLKN